MKKPRIVIIDILRGFALLLIVLIHFAEHFEFYSPSKYHFLFSQKQDDSVFFWALQFIRGNAYSIFALLFGVSFFIQMNNKAEKGIDFRRGFTWRMLVLLVIGFLFSLIYRGDILHMYAIFALPIILIYPWRTKFLFITAILLLLQPQLIIGIFQSFLDSSFKYVGLNPYWSEGNQLAYEGSFWDTVKFNFYKGRQTSWSWTIYVGRYLQIWGLFILGILIGRLGVFENIDQKKKLFLKAMLVTLPIAVTLAFISESVIKTLPLTQEQQKIIKITLDSWKNIFGSASYISLVTLLYIIFPKAYIFKLYQAYGKLSLTNYIVQGTIGVFLYYGFGLALWKYLGATWSLIIGAAFFFLQAYICTIWNKHFYYGPFEWLWRCLTDLNFNIPFKREKTRLNIFV